MEVLADFALKNGFRRNSIIGDQFRRNWLLNVCPNKVRKNVGRFRRNCPQFRWNYPDSDLVTNKHSPWKPYFGRIENCRHFSVFSRHFRIRRFLCWNVISAEVRKKDSPCIQTKHIHKLETLRKKTGNMNQLHSQGNYPLELTLMSHHCLIKVPFVHSVELGPRGSAHNTDCVGPLAKRCQIQLKRCQIICSNPFNMKQYITRASP